MLLRSLRPAISAVLLILFAACATNPASGKREFSLMSEAQEIELGKQYDGEVRREMGLYDDPELQRYVSDIGLRLAKASERPGLPWSFAVVDEPAINAFALPGGYIYLTRGILPYLGDEAELAGVLGHEIGHVTARHAAQRYTQATTAGLGVTLLSIFVPEARPFQNLTETALGVMFLKHGRDDELQADRLGVEYTASTGWDPAGVGGMLRTLTRLDEADGSRRGVPNWLATHPAPADRVKQIQAYIAKTDTTTVAGGSRNPDEFLRRIDGLVFGDSPSQGIVRGNAFLHPDLRLSLTFPQGWEVQNSREQVVAKAPERNEFMILQLVPNPAGSIEQIARGTMGNAGFQQLSGERAQLNGLDAYVGTYRGQMQGLGDVVTLAAHIVHNRTVYLFAGLAPPNGFESAQQGFVQSIRSFRELSAQEAANIRPNRVDVYTVRQGDTWESIAQRSTDGLVKPATLAIMNNYDPTQQPKPGQRIKIVVEG
ncbi:M48 family metalloprotease [soil metagenome]